MFVVFFSDLNLMLDITINRRAAWWRVSEVHHIHLSELLLPLPLAVVYHVIIVKMASPNGGKF